MLEYNSIKGGKFMKNLKIYRIDKKNEIDKTFNKSGLKIVAGLMAIITLTSCFTSCSKKEDPDTLSIIQTITIHIINLITKPLEVNPLKRTS